MVRAIDATQAETRCEVPAVVAGSAVVRCLWLRQLCVLVRNNLVGMLRRYVATFIEVLLMTVILMGIDKEAVVREPMRRHAATVYPTMPPTAYWNSSDSVDIREVWFAPESDYTARLTRIACRKLRVPKVSAASSAEQLAEKVTKHNATPATVTVVGLLFSGLTPNDSDPKTLHVSFYSGNLPMDIKLSYKERLLSEPEGPVDERRFPEMTTLLPIMGVLQQTHLELQAKIAGRTEPLAMPALRRFPYPAYLEYNDPNNYSLVFTRFCIGMLVPFALFVALVAEERASGKKELLRVTGVNDWVYWLGHVISGILKHLVTSAIMLVFLVVRRNDQNRAFIQYSNPLLVFLVLMCFCVSCRVHAALLSALIETPHTAMAMAMLLWTLLSAIPYLALEHPSGLGYQYIRRREKLGTAVFPGMNLHWSLRVLERFEKFVEHGANWGNFYDHDVTLDNVTLAELMFVGLAYNAVLGLTLWYLDNVLPVGPGVHRSPLFPFEFHYWMPALTDVEAVPKVGKEKQNFEAVGSNLPVAVELYHVSKDYNGVVAVSDVSFQIFEGQVTVLLGPNGNGKTALLKMITGFTDVSSGLVIVDGYDVTTSTREARCSMGYCPQNNILFGELTVEEHLHFFAVLRGVPPLARRAHLASLLQDVGLTTQGRSLAAQLLPGQQRRLSVAIAVLATPKLVVLDEPTVGMDSRGRRDIWDVLLKVRRHCTILLSTQNSEEADALGDRIAVMFKNTIRCAGSSGFLKRHFGVGYQVSMNKGPTPCNVPAIGQIVRKYAPAARPRSDTEQEAVFALGELVPTRNIIAMFKELEDKCKVLGIASLGVTAPSLEDAVIRVCDDHQHPLPTPVTSVPGLPGAAPHTAKQGGAAVPKGNLVDAKTKQSLVRAIATAAGKEPSWFARLWALVAKRATYVWRRKRQPLFSWLLPPLMLSLLFFLEVLALREGAPTGRKGGSSHTLNYTLQDVLARPLGFFQSDGSHEDFYRKQMEPLLSKPVVVRNVRTDADDAGGMLAIARNNLRRYVFNIHFAIQMKRSTGDVMWYNGQIQHIAPALITVYNNARLREITGTADARFSFDVTTPPPFDNHSEEHAPHGRAEKMPDDDDDDDSGINSSTTIEPTETTTTKPAARIGHSEYDELLPKVLRSIFFPLASSLMCSNFIILPIGERALKVKQLDLLSGVSPFLYWFSSYLWDFFFYMGTALLVVPPILAFHSAFEDVNIEAILLLNVLHGYAALPFIYLMSFLFVNQDRGFSTLSICTFIISSLGCFMAVFMEFTHGDVQSPEWQPVLLVLLWIFRLLPNFAYSRGMTKLLQLGEENSACRRGGEKLDELCRSTTIRIKQSLSKCCSSRGAGAGSAGVDMIYPFDVHWYSIFFEIVNLSIVGAILFGLLLLVESDYTHKIEVWFTRPDVSRHQKSAKQAKTDAAYRRRDSKVAAPPAEAAVASPQHDTEVAAEEALVQQLAWHQRLNSARTMEAAALLVCRLYRSEGYRGHTKILQGLSFGLRAGERLALLGADRAGMTTMFRILTGEIKPHEGDAYIHGFSLVNNVCQFRRYVGYCPQRDGLLDTLTGVETVSFYCRLRGIAPTAEYLAAVLEVFGIDEVADRPVGTYSLCSRRKLSLCIAVLGVPQVLLLDDPYASVAPSSRRHIVNYITEIQKGRQMSILLSSHSLLDVAFTCDRIAVLAGGRLQCLGSVARLKGRFARSITIVIRTSRDHGDDQENQRNVTRAVKKVIADACLVHACEGTLEFRVPSAQPPVWSDLFTQMGRLKRRFRFPEFSLADTPLENVLLAGPEGSPEMNGGATPNIAGPLPPGTAPLGLSAMTVGAGARRTSIVQHTTQTLDVDARWSAKESIHSQKSTTKLQ